MLFSDDVPCQKSAWFVGKQFLKEIFNTFLAMAAKAKRSELPLPYLFDYYNILECTSNLTATSEKSSIAKIYNNMMERINEKHLLPRFIVVMPDWNILQEIKFDDYGVSKIIANNIEWLVFEIESAIARKKKELSKIRKGTVAFSEPKVVWLKMIARPLPSRVLALRRKFNVILEETLCNTDGMRIIDVQDSIKRMHFDHSNKLTSDGRIAYWRAVDQHMKKLDQHKEEYYPTPVVSEAQKQAQEDKEPKFWLPKLPPFN